MTFSLQIHRWGYACCHSFVKFSYCTGIAGQEAEREAETYLTEATKEPNSDFKSLLEIHKEKLKEVRKSKNKATCHQEKEDLQREERVSY